MGFSADDVSKKNVDSGDAMVDLRTLVDEDVRQIHMMIETVKTLQKMKGVDFSAMAQLNFIIEAISGQRPDEKLSATKVGQTFYKGKILEQKQGAAKSDEASTEEQSQTTIMKSN